MKIYVDETPKDCWDCPMHDGENGWCKMLVCYTDYVPKDCPLQSVTDYTKQVREEVVEEIKKIADSIFARYENRELDDVAYGELVCCNILIKKFQRKEGNEQC